MGSYNMQLYVSGLFTYPEALVECVSTHSFLCVSSIPLCRHTTFGLLIKQWMDNLGWYCVLNICLHTLGDSVSRQSVNSPCCILRQRARQYFTDQPMQGWKQTADCCSCCHSCLMSRITIGWTPWYRGPRGQ